MSSSNKNREVPSWLGAALVAGAFGALWLWERRRPLRRSVEPKLERNARNPAVAGLAAAAMQLAERPLVAPLAALVKRRWGLLKRVPLPAWLEVVLAVVLLDYTLYLWHVLTHRVPAPWRFHLVAPRRSGPRRFDRAALSLRRASDLDRVARGAGLA